MGMATSLQLAGVVLRAGLVRRFNPTSRFDRLLDRLPVLLTETAANSVAINATVERSRVVLGLGITDHETGLCRPRKDVFEPRHETSSSTWPMSRERRDPLGDPLDILESHSVAVGHEPRVSVFVSSSSTSSVLDYLLTGRSRQVLSGPLTSIIRGSKTRIRQEMALKNLR